jgi:hypothetical protein
VRFCALPATLAGKSPPDGNRNYQLTSFQPEMRLSFPAFAIFPAGGEFAYCGLHFNHVAAGLNRPGPQLAYNQYNRVKVPKEAFSRN